MSTLAQTAPPAGDRYRVIQLGTLDGDTQSAAFGLNEPGQVVGISGDSPTFGSSTAFIWRPTPPPAEPNLLTKDTSGLALNSHAWDLNDEGIATGRFEDAAAIVNGFLWQDTAVDLGLPVRDFTAIGHLDLPPNEGTEGRGIQEIQRDPPSPPFIRAVGFSLLAGATLPPPSCDVRAFEVVRTLGGPTDPLADLDLGDCAVSRALGVNPGRDTTDPLVIVGIFEDCADDGCFSVDPCTVDALGSPAAWVGGMAYLLDTSVFAAPAGGGEARGANDLGEIVGLGRVPSTGRACPPRAAYWPSATALAQDLHAAQVDGGTGPAFTADHETEANAINEPGTVVGSEVDDLEAIRWRFDGLDWRAIRLDERIFDGDSPSPVCSWEWDLRDARDINDREWIVGRGRWDPDGDAGPLGDAVRAFLLVPCTPCDADLDGNGTVGFGDLTILLTNFGHTCCTERAEGTDICFVDLDCDNDVDFADQLILLAEWGRECSSDSESENPALVSMELLALWGVLGGEALSASGAITAAQIAECMSMPDEYLRFEALCGLLELQP